MPARKKTKSSNGSGDSECHHGACHKCHSGKVLLLGVLILLNVWLDIVSWWSFVGIILVLLGLIKWAWPKCPHC